MWLYATVFICVLIGIFLIRLRMRRIDWQLRFLSAKLNNLLRRKKASLTEQEALLRYAYTLLNRCIKSGNVAAAFHVIDGLRIAFGNGIIRNDEHLRLMSAVVAAIRANQIDIAIFVIDAFRPLVRRIPAERISSVTEQLCLVAVIAVRTKQFYLVSKIADIVLSLAEQIGLTSDRTTGRAIMKAVKIIGLISIRRNDAPLFREIVNRLAVNMEGESDGVIVDELIFVVSAWLSKIIKTNNCEIFELWLEQCYKYIDEDTFSGKYQLLIKEWVDIVGITVLNPNNIATVPILRLMFYIANKDGCYQCWRLVIGIAGKLVLSSVLRYGVAEGFPVAYPLLSAGRVFFAKAIQRNDYSEGNNLRILNLIVQECLVIAEHKARQDMGASVGRIIEEIFECWTSMEAKGNRKSIHKFCQILIMHWQKNRRKQAKHNVPRIAELFEPLLISPEERVLIGL